MPPLKVIIIGAGISGLAAALASRQQGHHVTLLEKSNFLRETGAALHLGPNFSCLLKRLGMDLDAIGAVTCQGFDQYKGNGDVKMSLELTEISKQWQYPWLLVHRVDLHRELKRLALDTDGRGPVPELRLRCMISDIDVDAGVVKLEDGTSFSGDALIGADGVHSISRNFIDPTAKAMPWGKSCYRWLIPMEVIHADEEMNAMAGKAGYFVEVSESDRRVIMYPCRDNSVVNFAAFLPEIEANKSADDFWHQQGNKALMQQGFEGFCSPLKKLLANADEDLKVWQLYDMKPLSTFAKGRLALIGDAAHPYLPFLAQGGAQAVEDSVSVAMVLTPETPGSEVAERFQLYDRIRRERATTIQDQTRINAMDEEKRPKTEGGLVFLKKCYEHDEWFNSTDKLREWQSQPNGAVTA